MIRADLYHAEIIADVKAVLVLCPGCNGNAESLICSPDWQAFAKKQSLGLVGVSFASELEDLHNGKGYYYAQSGSGKLLLDGVKKLYGRERPMLLYGFSGGAHFTSRFAEWKPDRVIAWCAYSAGWWDEPKPSAAMPPGIVACGENDERYGASLVYFKQGRAAGKTWLWISVSNNSHSPDGRVESFVRYYFESILENRRSPSVMSTGFWVDIDNGNIVTDDIVRQYPSLTGWLPNVRLLSQWRNLHAP
ncbi:MAG: hypothetical protein HZA88_20610 [Verrucomicrobia bacterium]|nr:hypothetical protein [Verrucomicrobiota bacterium]